MQLPATTEQTALGEEISAMLHTQRDRIQELLLRNPRDAIGASLLDSEIILATNDSEEALLAPVGSPAVTNHPIGNTVFLAPSDDTDVVPVARYSRFVLIDASLVLQKVVRNVNRAGHRAMRIDLLHNVLHTLHMSVLLHIVLCVVVNCPAAIPGVAVSTNVNVIACLIVASFVTLTALFGNTDLISVLINMDR